jgi:hypothetical protein
MMACNKLKLTACLPYMYAGVYDYTGEHIYEFKNTEMKTCRTKILSSVLYVWVCSLILH